MDIKYEKKLVIKVKQGGFTILELMVVLVIAGILSAVAYASYSQYAKRARVAAAIGDIGRIHMAIEKHMLKKNTGYPASLAELGLDNLTDPWGNPYQYLVIDGLNNNGAVRKDKNMVPVNRSYDIYSMGPDGVTATPFTSTLGRDDVVLAADGGYYGLAEDF